MPRPYRLLVSARLLVAPALALTALHADEPVVLDAIEVTGKTPGYLSASAPITVTGYAAAFLEAAHIDSYAELAPFVPGLFVSEQSIANTSYSLRGITTDNGDPRGSQRVSVFQDGILLSNNAGIRVAFFDLERIDVLKGPQTAAFGRGTQIGAIAITTQKPLNETSSSLSAGVGDYNARNASGHVNVPVVENKLFARVAFSADKADGYVKNRSDNSDLQGKDSMAVRGSLHWQPSARTTADLTVNYQHDTPPGVAFKNMSPLLTDGNPFSSAKLNRGRELGTDRTLVNVTAIVSHQLNEAWTVSSTTGWRDVDSKEELDADGSPAFLLEAGEYNRARQFSQELRFTYDNGGPLRGSLGGGFFWEKASQEIPLSSDLNLLLDAFGTPSPSPLPTDYRERFINYGETLSADVFGDVSYKVTRRLTLGAAVRLTHEELTSGFRSDEANIPLPFTILPTGNNGNVFFAPTYGRLQTDRDNVSWAGSVNAAFELTKQHTAYASVARSRRPPVTTYPLGPVFFPLNELQEESVWHYETGIKGTLADRRVSYDVAVFRYDYEHFETVLPATPPAVRPPTDGGKARGQGFEGTLQAKVSEQVSVFGTYGYTDARFLGEDENGNPLAFAGNTFRLSSRHTISLGATFAMPVDGVGTFFVTPTWQYRSGHFFEDDNQASGGSLHQDGFALINLRAGYRTPGNRWEVVFWVRNLLDKEYLIDAGNIGGEFGFPTSVRGAPRTLGVNVTARF